MRGRVGAGRERGEDAEPGHDLAGAGAAAGVASVTGRGMAGLACRLVTVGRRPQGIADGANGHAARIEADRAGVPTYLGAGRRRRGHGGPWSIDAHPSTGAGRMERRGDRQRQPGSGAWEPRASSGKGRIVGCGEKVKGSA